MNIRTSGVARRLQIPPLCCISSSSSLFSLEHPPRFPPRLNFSHAFAPSIHPPLYAHLSAVSPVCSTLPITLVLLRTSSRTPQVTSLFLSQSYRGSSSLASREDHRDASPRSCSRLPTLSRWLLVIAAVALAVVGSSGAYQSPGICRSSRICRNASAAITTINRGGGARARETMNVPRARDAPMR